MAEAAPRCFGTLIPGGLADVGAGRGIRGECSAANGQHQRVGGRQADLFDRLAKVIVAERAVVAGAGDSTAYFGQYLPEMPYLCLVC